MFFKTCIFSIAILIVFSALNAIAHDAELIQYEKVDVSANPTTARNECQQIANGYVGGKDDRTAEISLRAVTDAANNPIRHHCIVIVTIHNENHPSHTQSPQTEAPSPESTDDDDSQPESTNGGGGGGIVSGGGGAISGGGGSDDSPVSDDDGGSAPEDDTSEDPEPQVQQSQTQPPAPVVQAMAPPQVVVIETIRVTEYMVRDWSGVSGLPQWIELYNPNASPVDLTGYKFYYALYNKHQRKYVMNETPISLAITIPAKGTVILATYKNWSYGGIDLFRVVVLRIDNVLKAGWRLVDTNDNVIHEIGTAFTDGLVGDPIMPPHVNNIRQSYKQYASEDPTEAYFFGKSGDIGHPGFHKPVVQIGASPSNPYAKPKMVGIWGKLKQAK